jgi:hypothetical protein
MLLLTGRRIDIFIQWYGLQQDGDQATSQARALCRTSPIYDVNDLPRELQFEVNWIIQFGRTVVQESHALSLRVAVRR